ncbi:MAG: nucleoside triphosphate pyrophosphohydrolase [Acidimicrobiia bacterium]|nr:nucleoside triphosphate pyrophosphohydrolase [Acidimicrobiia bacterium]
MPLKVVGLGPAGLDRLPPSVRSLLLAPEHIVILRTLAHPAAAELALVREVTSCDDLYEIAGDFAGVYSAIVERVLEAAKQAPVIYAVPGSPIIGERAVAELRRRIPTEVVHGESFVDAVLTAIGYDPLERGLRLLDGHSLPDPLLLDGPTLVAQLDNPLVLADAAAALARVVGEGTAANLIIDAGGSDERVIAVDLEQIDLTLAGLRTSLFLDPTPGGLAGVIKTMARLRRECPWDQKQTHESLVKNLVEETHELIDAIASGNEGAIEDELGDVLLQVLFHSVVSAQAGGFGIEDVAENLRVKLVRRHPHVFGDVVARSADEVKASWEEIKVAERGETPTSILAGVSAGMPALERAAKLQRKAATVGFDWPAPEPVMAKVAEELEEVSEVLTDPEAAAAEIGDLLFAVVNLARHVGVDPELALVGSIQTFVARFEAMERQGPLAGLNFDELDARWVEAKRQMRNRPLS